MKFRDYIDGAWVIICPICGSTRPSPDDYPVIKPVYCNVNCYYLGHRHDPPETNGGDGPTATA
jgi:hypothetical protein